MGKNKQKLRKDFFGRYLIVTLVFLIIAISGLFFYGFQVFNKYNSHSSLEPGFQSDSIILKDKILTVWNIDKKDSCENVENMYLEYMCKRLRIRPHMSEFMSKTNSGIHESYGNCSSYEGFANRMCFLSSISEKSSTAYAKRDCKDDECRYYSLLPYFVRLPHFYSLKSNDNTQIDFLMSECKMIQDDSWRSECYYTIADELAFIEEAQFDKKYNVLSSLCTLSNEASDYLCFNHVAMLMDSEEGYKFCEAIDYPEMREECFFGIGAGIAADNPDDKDKILLACNFDDNYRFFCLKGAYDYIETAIFYSNRDVKDKVQVCESFESPFLERCLLKLAHELDGKKSECKDIPDKYRKFCSERLDDVDYDCTGYSMNAEYDYNTCMAFVNSDIAYCSDLSLGLDYGFSIPCEGVVLEEHTELDVYQKLFTGDIKGAEECNEYRDLEEKALCDVAITGNFDRCEGLTMGSKDFCYSNGRFFNALYEKNIEKCENLQDARMKAYCRMFIDPSEMRCEEMKSISCEYDYFIRSADAASNPENCLKTSNYYLALNCLNMMGE